MDKENASYSVLLPTYNERENVAIVAYLLTEMFREKYVLSGFFAQCCCRFLMIFRLIGRSSWWWWWSSSSSCVCVFALDCRVRNVVEIFFFVFFDFFSGGGGDGGWGGRPQPARSNERRGDRNV